MAEIPWYIYSIIGAAVAIISTLISFDDLMLFALIGIIMFLWGILKLLFSLLSSKGTSREHTLHASHVVRCDNCGVSLHALFNYCPKCGKRHR